MSDIVTGPMGLSSYETLQRDCLAGPLLEATTGEVGLAVIYNDRAFRFAADIARVTRDGYQPCGTSRGADSGRQKDAGAYF